MAFIPVSQACQLVVHQTGPSGLIAENVFGMKFDTTPLTQAATDATADKVAAAYDLLSDFISDQFEWTGITITDLRTEDGPQFESASSFPVTGGASTDPLPLQTAALVSWACALRGRSFRGRTYIGGWSEAYGAGAHMESTAHGALADWADAMMDPDLGLGIISRFHGVDPDTHEPIRRDPGIITDVVSRVAHDLWATQRRRAPR